MAYPIALDNDYGVWTAFANHYWPAIYLADAEGRIRYHHFGEGEYAMTEMVIQQLLTDAGADGIDPDLVLVDPDGLEVAADWQTLRSSETYVGYGQSAGFASADIAGFDEPRAYELPPLRLNQWGLSGTWTVARHAGLSQERGGRVAYRFHARDLNLVMGPAPRGAPVAFRVLLDGEPPGAAAGADVKRRRQRHPSRPADLPADPPVGTDRRAPLRDRVPRDRRRSVLLYVRLEDSSGRAEAAGVT